MQTSDTDAPPLEVACPYCETEAEEATLHTWFAIGPLPAILRLDCGHGLLVWADDEVSTDA